MPQTWLRSTCLSSALAATRGQGISWRIDRTRCSCRCSWEPRHQLLLGISRGPAKQREEASGSMSILPPCTNDSGGLCCGSTTVGKGLNPLVAQCPNAQGRAPIDTCSHCGRRKDLPEAPCGFVAPVRRWHPAPVHCEVGWAQRVPRKVEHRYTEQSAFYVSVYVCSTVAQLAWPAIPETH